MVGTPAHLPSVTAVSVDVLFLVVMVCLLVEVSRSSARCIRLGHPNQPCCVSPWHETRGGLYLHQLSFSSAMFTVDDASHRVYLACTLQQRNLPAAPNTLDSQVSLTFFSKPWRFLARTCSQFVGAVCVAIPRQRYI